MSLNGTTTVTDNTNLNTNTAAGNPLSEDDNKILNECDIFANELLLIIRDLKSQGRTNGLLLKFPRSDLERIMGFNTQSQSVTLKTLQISKIPRYFPTLTQM